MSCRVIGIFTMPDGSKEIRLKHPDGRIEVHNFPTQELLQAWIHANVKLMERGRQPEKRKKFG